MRKQTNIYINIYEFTRHVKIIKIRKQPYTNYCMGTLSINFHIIRSKQPKESFKFKGGRIPEGSEF